MEHRTHRALTIFFAALFFLNVGFLLLGFASIPTYYARVTTLTIPENTIPFANYPTNETVQESASKQHLTLAQYAVGQIIFHSAFVLLFMTVALLIVWRARWNWFAWFSAFFLVFIAEFAFFDELYIANLLPYWVYDAASIFWPLAVLYFFLFPNGKPAPRRAMWLVAPAVALHFIFQTSGVFLLVFPNAASQIVLEGVLGLFQTVILGVLLFILGCQVYRYLRVSTREEKQQTKWFLFGFILFMVLSSASEALGSLNPFADEISLLIFAFVPLSVGVAILRYRLFDIDIIIRRTLIYSILTAMLALFYFGSVVVLQQILRPIIGSDSDLAIIISTLAIAALFNPLRHRVQDTIDHRFYRRKYDAQQVLERFGATARDEVELEKLTSELLNVVNETMQPTQVSLWLKKQEAKRE